MGTEMQTLEGGAGTEPKQLKVTVHWFGEDKKVQIVAPGTTVQDVLKAAHPNQSFPGGVITFNDKNLQMQDVINEEGNLIVTPRIEGGN
jgi:hypothetical protein